MKLTKLELKRIRGGAINGWLLGAIGAGITFLIGILDGFTRPFRCR